MTTIVSPKIQYETLQLFLNADESDLTDRVLQYNYGLIDINGFFPVDTDNHEADQFPQFISVDAKESDLDHDIYILHFHQTGTEHLLKEVANIELDETNIIQLNQTLINSIKNHPLDHFYYRLKFNYDAGDADNPENIIMISFQQMRAYAHVIYSIMNMSSPHAVLTHQWQQIPLKQIRARLYQYALDHVEISKLWICILSTSLFVYYEIDANQNELSHQHEINSILEPYIQDPLLFVISPISECFDLESKENQESLNQYALLYDRSKWQFWLINWFRIHKATMIIETEKTKAA